MVIIFIKLIILQYWENFLTKNGFLLFLSIYNGTLIKIVFYPKILEQFYHVFDLI